LAGLNKDAARKEWGEEQVHIWRRSYDIPPPGGESLKNTAERVLPYFNAEILPRLTQGENILVAAHGNSLRSLVMQLDNLSKEEVIELEIPTGAPIIYTFSGNESPISKENLFG
jgi:2,3-bisphosphoglycerate-dependent phosphoglycerate mutase